MAVVVRDGEPVEVPTAEVVAGDLLLIRPGAKDSRRRHGRLKGPRGVDESMVTGESLPVSKAPGRQRSSAPRSNTTGTLRVRATKVGPTPHCPDRGDGAAGPELQGARAAPVADRAAFWLVLVALIGGTVTFLVWWAVGAGVQAALLFAITVVVITCPTPWVWLPDGHHGGYRTRRPTGCVVQKRRPWETQHGSTPVVMDKTAHTFTKARRKSPISLPRDRRATNCWLWSPGGEGVRAPLGGGDRALRHRNRRRRSLIDGFPQRAGARRHRDGRQPAGRCEQPQIMVEEGGLPTALMGRRDELAASGRTAVPDRRRRAGRRVVALADAARETIPLTPCGAYTTSGEGGHAQWRQPATATRIADQLGIDTVIAEVLPGDKGRQDRRPAAEPGPHCRHGRRRRQRRPAPGPG